MTKVSYHPKGYTTKLNTLLKYLENDANKKREDAILIDGHNTLITQSELHDRDYWHGIIAPSVLECRELNEHYKSDDSRYAAIKHG